MRTCCHCQDVDNKLIKKCPQYSIYCGSQRTYIVNVYHIEMMGTLLRHYWLFLLSTSPLSMSAVSTLTYPVRTKYVAVKLASERSYSLFQQACEACECYTKVSKGAATVIMRGQHLKLGTHRRVLYRPGSTVFVSKGECGVSGRAQLEWVGGVWVDRRRPSAQLSLDIQPLEPCTTYVEARASNEPS